MVAPSTMSSVRNSVRIVDERHWCRGLVNNTNADAFGFALRMSLVLTVSAFFVLYPFPQGNWIYITCLVVSWFPSSMSAASVLKKTSERIVGTIIGSILALLVGGFASSFPDVNHQAAILGSAVFVLSFGVSFLFVYHSKVIGKHPYASLLVLLTFGIVVFPFYNTQDEDVWMGGLIRIFNMIF